MAIYLAPYVGSGTRRNPFRPLGADQPGWAAIDLRADCTRPDGYALLHLSGRQKGLVTLGEDAGDTVPRALERKLGVNVSRGPLGDAIARLLLRPPPRGWRRLMPTGDRYEVWLGGLLWASPVFHGASATDNFNRADETPLAAPWVKSGAGQNMNLASNAIAGTTGTDTFYYYTGAAVTADQYSQVRTITAGPEAGPACRILGTNITGYFIDYITDVGIVKHLAGTPTVVQAITVTWNAGDTGRLEVQGSTLRAYRNGVLLTPAGTDTSITGAGAGVGVFDLFGAAEPLDDWAGGDLLQPGPGDNPPIGLLGRGAGW